MQATVHMIAGYFYSVQLYMIALKLGKNYILFHDHR